MADLIHNPLTERGDCATGDHAWRTTSRVGISICTTCGKYAYCLFCVGQAPIGEVLRPYRLHRHTSPRINDAMYQRKDLLQ
ncbi:MAG TPA: hypothetical protein VFV38_50215 [Ktedonobacteraceae bacterium]|nr:hypothetical protein [Ktedonobacteraceae bacterium]